MARLSPEQPIVTLIHVFTVEPKRQQPLVELLAEATEMVTSFEPHLYAVAFSHGGA